MKITTPFRRPKLPFGSLLLLAALLLGGSAAQAQTALIAHRSHGGAARTFRPGQATHTFGLPPKSLITEKIVWLRGTELVRHSYWVTRHDNKRLNRPMHIDTLDLQAIGQPNLAEALKWLRKEFPKAKLVGLDKKKMQAAWTATQ